MSEPASARRLGIFLSFSGKGGVERMVLRLAGGIAARGIAVDLLAVRASGVKREELPAGVNVIDMGTRHSQLAAPALASYLRARRPDALLAAKDRAIRTAVIARWLARSRTRVVGRLGTNLSAALEGRGAVARWSRYLPMRLLYRHVDAIVAVSRGVAEDTRRITRLPGDRLRVVRNPVVGPDLAARAAAPSPHEWLGSGVPVILGAGRLTRQKDFPTLLRAFARLRARRPARLVILGDGAGRGELEGLAAEAGVSDDLALVGHVDNPYRWLARADLFVLSSAWEGSPNVLTEAVACGTPVVATDCPSGPRELLDQGRYGPLVPVGDDEAMAEAMARVLDDPPDARVLREAAAAYTVEASVDGYLTVLGLKD